jgi:hypothetical protein
VLEPIPATRGHGHVGVQAEALEAGAARPRGRWGSGRAEAVQRVARTRPEPDPPLEGRGDSLREERFLRRERIRGVSVLGRPASPHQEPPDATLEPREERRDVGVGGWRQAMEHGPRRGRRARGDAVEEERVKVHVGVQGAAELLNRGDPAAMGPDELPPGRLPLQPAEDGAQEDA